jgi:serine protease Do
MRSRFLLPAFASATGLLLLASLVPAQQPFTEAAQDVNKKMVKLFGAGGFKGMPSYGTGIVVSPDGYILTVNNHILNTADLRVHIHDGRLYNAKVVAREPDLDVALLKIEADVDKLPFFDIEKEVKKPMAEVGDWILCHSNQFQIATRNEPMSVQRGDILAISPLKARRGVFDPPFEGTVYFIDTVACNPGAAGGCLTNRKGDLLGILGRELKSTQSETWINYAIPIQAKVDVVKDDGKTVKVDYVEFIKEGMKGTYREGTKKKKDKRELYTGIKMVVASLPLTPPYVEEVIPGSPAAKAKLQPDDLIVYVDGELVQSVKEFLEAVSHANPGQDLQLEVQRGNQLKTVKLKVEEMPKTK